MFRFLCWHIDFQNYGSFCFLPYVTLCLLCYGHLTIYQHMFPPRNLLLVYGQPHALELLGKLKQRGDRYQIKQVVAAEVGEDNIVAMAEGYDGVMLCDIPTVTRNYILKECFDKSIRVYMTPKISDILVRSSREMHI